MRSKNSPRFVIHPSIDSLAERVAAVTAQTPEADVAALREACRGKVRSYPVDTYLRTLTDATAGRSRYETVARFTVTRAS